ncbi:MAG: ferrochelatase [Firmicutes bacterium]|nr:ferrochelatase [Bacillota bacterium]
MIGVLVMAYGAAQDQDDLPRYYTHIRHGRPSSAAQLEDLRARYLAIGGGSPLYYITKAQAEVLEQVLNSETPNTYRVYLGLKHAPPFIEEGVKHMVEDGVDQAVGLILAPHYSAMSVGAYLEEAKHAVKRYHASLPWHGIQSWHLEPSFIEAVSQRVATSLASFDSDNVMVIFSAHSLPQRILATGDPYPKQLRDTGEAVAEYLALPHYTFSWQSAGRTDEPWMGPDILEKITSLQREGWNHQLVCPVGFVSDHLEILYDIDIQAQNHAKALDVHLERTPSFNSDYVFAQVLADVVKKALNR